MPTAVKKGKSLRAEDAPPVVPAEPEATTPPGAEAPEGMPEGSPEAVEPTDGAPRGVAFRAPGPETLQGPTSEIDKFLYGETTRPDESQTRSVNQAHIPDYVYEALPVLIRAAQDPDASPALLQLVRLLNYRITGG